MIEFKQVFSTPEEHSKGKNTCEYITLHHTGTQEGTIKGVLDGLYKREDFASCHFVIDINGDIYKIGTPEDILWHVGESAFDGKKDMNKYSVGIEVIGPLKNGSFTDLQRRSVKELMIHLMKNYNISIHRIGTHQEMAMPRGRKTDIAPSFWQSEFKTFNDWKNAKLKF
jgi:N-acetylmuramoyl-L-alanine amidase